MNNGITSVIKDVVPVVALDIESPTSDAPTLLDPRKGRTITSGLSDFDIVKKTVDLYPGDIYRVGRAKQNEMVLLNPDVSRYHAAFNTSATGVVVSDLSSLIGTYVNDKRILHPVALENGDKVTIGRTVIRLRMNAKNLTLNEINETQRIPMITVIMTLLVVDIRGYTNISRQLPTTEVAEMLNLWLSQITEIVKQNGGSVDKVMGDGLMAFWVEDRLDANKTDSYTALEAVTTASQILQLTKELEIGGKWPYSKTHPWDCRVVINTGDALLGSSRGSSSRRYTILGNTVNITFKLEKIASKMGIPILMTSSTAKRVDSYIALKSLGTVSIDEIKDSVAIFSLA